MNDRWYYAKDKRKRGPVSQAELRTLLARGELLPTDMILQEGTPRWIGASSLLEPPPVPAPLLEPPPLPAPVLEPPPLPAPFAPAEVPSAETAPRPPSPNLWRRCAG